MPFPQLVDDLAASLRVRRSDLNVVATAKGLFAGAVKLVLTDGSELSSADRVRLTAALNLSVWTSPLTSTGHVDPAGHARRPPRA